MSRTQLVMDLEGYVAADAQEEAHRTAMLSFLRATPDAFLRSHLAGHMTASALVLDAERKACLLLLHRKLDRWLQPGGHADGVEDLESVARKEVAEETGLTELTRLQPGIFDVDIHPIPARKGIPQHFHFDVRYLFRAPPEAQPEGNHESQDLAWVPLATLQYQASDESILRMVRKAMAM